jgi:hypothetical protein
MKFLSVIILNVVSTEVLNGVDYLSSRVDSC